jgi:hypothetical protein
MTGLIAGFTGGWISTSGLIGGFTIAESEDELIDVIDVDDELEDEEKDEEDEDEDDEEIEDEDIEEEDKAEEDEDEEPPVLPMGGET